ncbi:MAG: permease prefix domain 1-containing protein [Eubacterium sp.]|nr:permease prefix domain 1-containing protein [Eubacterium sp.]
MKKEEYIENVLKHIHNKAFINTIANELDEHIDDRQAFYKDCGYDSDTALQKAVEHMGSPDNIGEQMNRLYSNTKTLITGIIALLVYIGGLIFTVIDIPNFMIISTDPGDGHFDIYIYIVSLITFASGMLCYTLSLKHRMKTLMTVFGLINLVGMLSPFTFLAFGYSIAGFCFEFPGVSVMPWLPHTIGVPIGGENSNLAYILIYTFTGLFFAVPLVSGMISLLCAKEIKAQQHGFFSEKRLRHFKRYGALLLALTIIGTVTLTVEISVYKAEIWKERNLLQILEPANTVKAFDVYDSIELPFDKKNLESINSQQQYRELDANTYGYVLTMVYSNEHYSVQLADNDADGIYEEKRIYANTYSDITKSDIEKITADMTTREILDLLPREQINDYSYTVTENGYEEEFYIYSFNGISDMQRNPSELHIIAQNGTITQFEYYPD